MQTLIDKSPLQCNVCCIEELFLNRTTSHSRGVRRQQINETLMTVIKMEQHMLACWRMNCWVLVLRTWKNSKMMLVTCSVQHYCQRKREISFRLLYNHLLW